MVASKQCFRGQSVFSMHGEPCETYLIYGFWITRRLSSSRRANVDSVIFRARGWRDTSSAHLDLTCQHIAQVAAACSTAILGSPRSGACRIPEIPVHKRCLFVPESRVYLDREGNGKNAGSKSEPPFLGPPRRPSLEAVNTKKLVGPFSRSRCGRVSQPELLAVGLNSNPGAAAGTDRHLRNEGSLGERGPS